MLRLLPYSIVLCVVLLGTTATARTDDYRNGFDLVSDGKDTGRYPSGDVASEGGATFTDPGAMNPGLCFSGGASDGGRLPETFRGYSTSHMAKWTIAFWVSRWESTSPDKGSFPEVSFLSMCSTTDAKHGGAVCNSSDAESWRDGLKVSSTVSGGLLVQVRVSGISSNATQPAFFSTDAAANCFIDGLGCMVVLSFDNGDLSMYRDGSSPMSPDTSPGGLETPFHVVPHVGYVTFDTAFLGRDVRPGLRRAWHGCMRYLYFYSHALDGDGVAALHAQHAPTLSCDPGTAAQPGHSTCAACAPGKFKAAAGKDACANCAANTFVATPGATACKACTEHSSSGPNTGLSQPCPCDAGYVPGDHASLGRCVLCPAGQHTSGSSSTCAACAAGTFRAEPRPELACQGCPSGHFAASPGAMSCASCGPDSSSFGGADVCQCDAGYYRPPGSDDSSPCTQTPESEAASSSRTRWMIGFVLAAVYVIGSFCLAKLHHRGWAQYYHRHEKTVTRWVRASTRTEHHTDRYEVMTTGGRDTGIELDVSYDTRRTTPGHYQSTTVYSFVLKPGHVHPPSFGRWMRSNLCCRKGSDFTFGVMDVATGLPRQEQAHASLASPSSSYVPPLPSAPVATAVGQSLLDGDDDASVSVLAKGVEEGSAPAASASASPVTTVVVSSSVPAIPAFRGNPWDTSDPRVRRSAPYLLYLWPCGCA